MTLIEIPLDEIHDFEQTRFPGHWRCSCGYVGTDEMMARHAVDVGWCPDCWGSGSDAYPSLGLCRSCGGSGEIETDGRRRTSVVCQHPHADAYVHWSEDGYGVETRIECGCPCLTCREY